MRKAPALERAQPKGCGYEVLALLKADRMIKKIQENQDSDGKIIIVILRSLCDEESTIDLSIDPSCMRRSFLRDRRNLKVAATKF